MQKGGEPVAPSDDHLVAARFTPDGTIALDHEQRDVSARIRDGDPTLDWLGDDRLSLHVTPNFEGSGVPRFEVWRDHEGTAPTLVMHRVCQSLGTGDGLIRQLAAHDTRVHDMTAEILGARDAREAAERARFAEFAEGTADKIAFALGRDLSAPAQSGRVYRIGG